MFVSLHNPPLKRKQSARVGWLVMPNGCHIWTGARSARGYGVLTTDSHTRDKKTWRAHVYRYEREVGPVPTGMQLDHFVCDNPSCCNPEHVRPVTPWENTLRSTALSALNAAKTHCKRGHPFAGENTGPRAGGGRRCKQCERETTREWRARRAKTDGTARPS